MSAIQGVVGSIEIERNGDSVRITVTFGNGLTRKIDTVFPRVQHLWLPALSAKEYRRAHLDTEGDGVEIITMKKLTYIEPRWRVDDKNESPQAIFTLSQVDQIKKALKQ